MVDEGWPGNTAGGEAEEPTETEAPSQPLDPVAAALAIEASRLHPKLAEEAAAYFKDQRRLVSIQTEHLHEQRNLTLSHLRLRRVGDWFRTLTQLLILLTATAILLGLVLILRNAIVSKAVVVEAFDTPPSLAAQGISGKALASAVLDALQNIEISTRTSETGINPRSEWSSDVKIEVPESGVSVGEINRLFHQYLGNDVHIGGDLIQTESGLLLTVRGDGVPAKSFSGAAVDLEKLATQAAEYVYSCSQPGRFAAYLLDSNRIDEVLTFSQTALAGAETDEQRSGIANAWGNALYLRKEFKLAREKFALAVSLDPFNWHARENLLAMIEMLDSEEAAWRASQSMLLAAANAPSGKHPAIESLEIPYALTWDIQHLLESLLAETTKYKGKGTSYFPDGTELADAYAEAHDLQAAERYVILSDPNNLQTKVEALVLKAHDAEDRNDAPSALAPMSALANMASADPNFLAGDGYCYAGWALGMAGRMKEADAIFSRVGPLSRCAALHGDVLEHAGDLPGALRLWAGNIRIAPDLPMVYLHRGLSELRRGDLKAAEVDFTIAHHNAPHYADPLKAWGDVYAREGRWSDALRKYNEALKYAPNWTALHQARDVAAERN